MKKTKYGSLLVRLLFVVLSVAVYFAAYFALSVVRALVAFRKGIVVAEADYLKLSTPAVVGLYLAAFVAAVIIHECGHLIFGWLGGGSFRVIGVFGFALARGKNGKPAVGRMAHPGALGFCGMILPDREKGRKLSFFLQTLGGPLANLLVSLAAGAAYVFSFRFALFTYCLSLTILCNFCFFMLNLLPIGAAAESDGSKYRRLRNDPAGLENYRKLQNIHGMVMQGVRFRDMPEELFPAFPLTGEIALEERSLADLRAYRLIDSDRFAEAEGLYDGLLGTNAGTPAERTSWKLESLSLTLLRDRADRDKIAEFLSDGNVREELKRKRDFDALRASYILALLYDKNSETAAGDERTLEKRSRDLRRSYYDLAVRFFGLARKRAEDEARGPEDASGLSSDNETPGGS